MSQERVVALCLMAANFDDLRVLYPIKSPINAHKHLKLLLTLCSQKLFIDKIIDIVSCHFE